MLFFDPSSAKVDLQVWVLSVVQNNYEFINVSIEKKNRDRMKEQLIV